jgi:hypothetical protein
MSGGYGGSPRPWVRLVDGQLVLSARAVGLLVGVPEAEVDSVMSAQLDGTDKASWTVIDLPEEWMRRGRRRSREAAAALGSSDLLDVLAYYELAERHGGSTR